MDLKYYFLLFNDHVCILSIWWSYYEKRKRKWVVTSLEYKRLRSIQTGMYRPEAHVALTVLVFNLKEKDEI